MHMNLNILHFKFVYELISLVEKLIAGELNNIQVHIMPLEVYGVIY